MARRTKTTKINAQYRLPEPLFKRVKIQAAKEGVQPCRLVERLLDSGLKSPPAAEPAAAT